MHRIGRDLRERRHVDVYVVAGASVVIALLSLVGDLVPEGLRWSVVLAALGLLTYQIAAPDHTADPDALLSTRDAFVDVPVRSRVRGAREVWVYGPSAVNLLSEDFIDALRSGVLGKADGVVRVVVLDPEQRPAVAIAASQLDAATDFPNIELPDALAATSRRLASMAAWDVAGTFEHRLAPFNPGFSLFIVDPGSGDGTAIVEFHGLRNESTGRRMHVELTRRTSAYWYAYWVSQFVQLWDRSRPPDRPASGSG